MKPLKIHNINTYVVMNSLYLKKECIKLKRLYRLYKLFYYFIYKKFRIILTYNSCYKGYTMYNKKLKKY